MAKTISKDTPLNELILRRYEKPYSLGKRDLVRKYCLSVGLLQPGDSRDIVVDILFALLLARGEKKEMSSEEIKDVVIELRKAENLPLVGIAPSNIRRQLKRLRDVMIAEKVKNSYRITEFSNLDEIFEQKLEQFLIPNMIQRIKEYHQRIDEEFRDINSGSVFNRDENNP
ncbi:MAG: hypothetical protein ACLFPQ_03910 [Candidatus Woesearchaeota archaeon]